METKTCSVCFETHPIDFFSKNGNRLRADCKNCSRKKNVNHYENNKESHNELKKKRRAKLQDFINNLKSNPCVDCGMSYDPYVMDFDHCRGDKVNSVSKMTNTQRCSEAKLLAEIAKCDLVCSNCHRIRTKKRMMGLTA